MRNDVFFIYYNVNATDKHLQRPNMIIKCGKYTYRPYINRVIETKQLLSSVTT